MYTIEIEYKTGDSFGSEELTEQVGYVWDKIEDAKLTLSYIKEHWKLYAALHDRNVPAVKVEKLLKAAKSRPWFYISNDPLDRGDAFGYWTRCIIVVDNSGGTTSIGAFWTGYFERLLSATVVACVDDNDNDMRFVP